MDIIANLARVLGFQQQQEQRQDSFRDIVIQQPSGNVDIGSRDEERKNIRKKELEEELKEVRDYRDNFEKNNFDMRDEGDKEIMKDLNNQENKLLEELNIL